MTFRARAFESGQLHKNKIAVFYICRKQEESPSKRPAQDVKHGKYYSITAFCRYFKFFLSFCNINFLNVFLRKCNCSTSVPRRQRYVYFYGVSTCMILNFRAFNSFFLEKNKESRIKKCLLNIGWWELNAFCLALIQCNVHFYRKVDITTVMKSHQTILCSQILPRNEPKPRQSLHKHWLK